MGWLQVYETSALPATSNKNLLLLLPDGFGHVKHNFILADSLAEKGWHVLVPDYYEGQRAQLQFHAHGEK